MTDETPKQRKTRLARERKRAQRKRDSNKRLAMGASKLKMEIYRGNRLDELRRMTRAELDARIDLVIGKVKGTRYVSQRQRKALPKPKR